MTIHQACSAAYGHTTAGLLSAELWPIRLKLQAGTATGVPRRRLGAGEARSTLFTGPKFGVHRTDFLHLHKRIPRRLVVGIIDQQRTVGADGRVRQALTVPPGGFYPAIT